MEKEIALKPMTRDMCHDFYRMFKNDAAVFAPDQAFEEYEYSPEKVERYWREQDVPDRRVFAIMLDDEMIGEVKLKYINVEKAECSMGIHLLDDTVKGKGYGTRAEQLVLNYAFDVLKMKAVHADALLANTRSQHVLEKVGFRYVRQDERFKYYLCERKDR